MVEDAKTAEAQASTDTQPAAEKTPEQLEKEAKKKAKKAEKEAAKKAKEEAKRKKQMELEAQKHTFVKDPNDPCADKFGDLPLNQSQCDPNLRFERKYTSVGDLSAELKDQEVRVRCRVHNSRAKGNMCFIVGRESYSTV